MAVAATAGRASAAARTAGIVLGLGLVALFLIGALASMSWPMGWDQGIFAWIGHAVLRGALPYRDAWDIKGPLAYLAFAGAEQLFGHEMWGIRVADLVLLSVASGAVFAITRAFVGSLAAFLTAVLLSLHHLALGYWTTAQPDGWMAFALTVAVWLLVDRRVRDGLPAQAAAAALAGLGLILKPTYAAFALLPAIALLNQPGLDRPRRWGRGVLLGLVFAAPAIATLVWFWASAALPSYLEGYLAFNAQSVAGERHSPAGMLGRVGRLLLGNPALILAILPANAALFILHRRAPRSATILTAWVGASLLTILAQGRFLTSHWHVLYWSVGTLAGIGLGYAAAMATPRWVRPMALAWTGLACGLIALPVAGHIRLWLRYAAYGQPSLAYYRQFEHHGTRFDAADDIEASGFVIRETSRADRVLVWPSALVNFLSDREPPGRFANFVPFGQRDAAARETALQHAYRLEFLAALESAPPALILVSSAALSPTDTAWWGHIPSRFPALRHLLDSRYRPAGAVAGYLVFRPR